MPIHWLTTQANPNRPATGFDAGQTGWRLHALDVTDDALFSEIRRTRSICGLMPRHGWSLDLFIDRKCERCEKKLTATA